MNGGVTSAPGSARSPIVLAPREGRHYPMPAMHAVFKADGAETANRYSVSEWWLKPMSPGPGAHRHDGNDEIFHVLAGTMSILVGERWIDAPAGTLVIVPAGMTHDFENRTEAQAGLLNVFVPGGFEERMPAVVEWFEKNAAGGA